MSVKKIVFMTCFVLQIHAPLFAQPFAAIRELTPEQRAQVSTEWMTSELALEPDIFSSLYSINLKYANLNEEILSSGEKMMAKANGLKANNEAKDEEIGKILTKDQYKEYQQKKSEIKEALKARVEAQKIQLP